MTTHFYRTIRISEGEEKENESPVPALCLAAGMDLASELISGLVSHTHPCAKQQMCLSDCHSEVISKVCFSLPGFRISISKPGQQIARRVVVHICNPSTWEVEAGGSEAQRDPQLHNKFKTNWGFTRPCLKSIRDKEKEQMVSIVYTL